MDGLNEWVIEKTQKKERIRNDLQQGKRISVLIPVPPHDNLLIGLALKKEFPQILIRSRYFKYTKEQEEDIKKRYLDNESLRNIAKDYNTDHPAIGRLLKKLGVEIRSWEKTD